MKRAAWSHFVFVFLIGLLLSGCAGLASQAEAITQPAFNSGETVSDTAVLPNAPAPQNPIPQESVPASPSQNQAPVFQDGLNALFAQEQVFVNIYDRVNPAVVHIGVGGGQGSGFVYDAQGHIVTNNHVVEGGGQIVVSFADGRSMPAQLVGTDPDSDLAIIRVDVPASELSPITLADSDQLKVGQMVIAIGNPFGLSGTMTTGIISSLDRELNGSQYIIPDVIQTDAAINPGNSGGPLLDLQGRVIGVNSAIRSASNSSSGIGFAVPANIVQAVAPQLIGSGSVAHPWLGISGGSLTPNGADQLGLSAGTSGVIVSTVSPGGPAATAGLRGGNAQGLGGDIITAVNNHPVTGIEDLVGYLVQHTVVGETINLQIIRDGNNLSLPLTLGARPSDG